MNFLPDSIAALWTDNPVVQAILIGLATFILEDPTTIGSGLLVAEGKIHLATAFLGLWIGIAAGDMGLYAAGMLLGPKTVVWGLLNQNQMDRAKRWFDRNLILAVLGSRFMPGMRLPTYLGAGLFKANPLHFLGLTILATLLWTAVLLALTVKIGEAVFPLLGAWRWPVAMGLLFVIVTTQWIFRRRRTAKEAAHNVEPIVSFFEFWPPWLFYIPVGFYYAWLTLRFRSFTLPTAANPGIFAGGLINESKNDILAMIPAGIRAWFAPHASYVLAGDPGTAAAQAEAAMAAANISYPVVVKPDRGMRGAAVKPVDNHEEMIAYLGQFASGTGLQIQRRVPFENEVGILYYRRPSESRGHVFSITRKYFPIVTGDGEHTLRDLILADPRARILQHLYLPLHQERLEWIPEKGEAFRLIFVGSHARGAIFKNGMHLLTPELEAQIDTIARAIPGFYFGRFDIRFRDEELLGRGTDFQIVEVNGAGAEATHIWDARTTLTQAYATLFQQFRILFVIGAENRSRGYQALGPVRFVKACIDYRKLRETYPTA
ncbi:MAG: VTT domain-containing protein [Candidatus Hydrogenedentes bacterium]|nr:VTT domain-containing protein [Candidatus Hydrogenedentota bacterium]